MSDMLGIASNGINAYQRALSTVSNNIANVNTDGYSRQDVVLQDSAPKKDGSMYMGTGVLVQTIKRQFDTFAESNLRNSTSDLSSQKPMVDYAKRVMDILGDKNVGLSSALDTFFSSASALSADPASTVLRSSFINSADGVASRFGELSGQMDLVKTETRQALDSCATQVNTLTSQLALINQSLTKEPDLASQPPELLDRRDLALRQLSDLVRIKTSFTPNGTVSVSLGSTFTQGVVVDGIKSRPIGLNAQVSDKAQLVLDPYGKTETLDSVTGGQIGGYNSFISQVLEPAQKNLNQLAQTFVSETNAIQKNGIDAYGQTGQEMFSVDPTAAQPAAGIKLLISDAQRVATASQFRITEGGTNVSSTRASVLYAGTTPTTALSNSNIVNNPNASAGVTFKVDGANEYTPVTALSAGVKATFYLDQASPNQQLQVMTKDGRQLLGSALTETQKYQLFKPANGFDANATYSDKYLNQSGSNAYRGLDLFYGAKATVLQTVQYDKYGAPMPTVPTPAVMTTDRLSSLDAIDAGALTLNGVGLSAYVPQSGSGFTVKGLNLGAANPKPDVAFSAVVNGQSIALTISGSGISNIASLASTLNSSLLQFGLKATTSHNGEDIQVSDAQGRAISGVNLAPVSNAEISNILPTDVPAAMTLQVGGQSVNVTDLTPTNNLIDLAKQIQQKLQGLGLNGLSVSANGASLILNDLKGRALSTVALTSANGNPIGSPAVTDYQGASAGTISVQSSANSVADWLNGSSTATASNIQFGNGQVPGLPSFNACSLSIGGVKLQATGLTATNLPDLAKQLQDSLRALDKSTSISVDYKDANLIVTDSSGRSIGNFGLAIAPGMTGAFGGTVAVQNSTLTQTGIRAEAFSEIRVPATQLDFTKALVLNGQSISGFKNLDQLVLAINNSSAGVQASVGTTGELVISDPQGSDIRVNSTIDGNALNIQAGTFSGQVRMVQEVPDMRVAATSLDFNKPLQINGINIAQASYTLPADGTSLSTQFGTIAPLSASTLQDTLNDRSSLSLSGISFGSPGALDAFSGFSIKVGNSDLKLGPITLTSTPATVTELASKIQTGLQSLPEGAGLSVSADLSGNLVVTDTSQPKRELTSISLSTSTNGLSASASNGKQVARFSDSFIASVANGKLVVQPIAADMTDLSVANTLNIKSNGTDLPADPKMSSITDMVARLNSKVSQTGVSASIDANNDLILSVTDPKAQSSISIGPGKDPLGNYGQNALGLEPLDYDVSKRLQQLLASNPTKSDIRMSFGTYGTPPNDKSGTPSDLSKIGLRTGAFIEGGCADDLLVFITAKGAAKVSASFNGQPDNQRDSLRSQSLSVKFTAADRYSIIDNKTGTELADRHYDPSVLEPTINFEGLQLKLSHAPSVGDEFQVDGNSDGLGNNVNMLNMVDLNKKPVLNGKTIANNYIDQINNVGNLAQQATINQQAMTVVNDQAVAARDKVSGVNLDQEASDLIRYQQAYQACAKALQISGTLFDAINQIR